MSERRVLITGSEGVVGKVLTGHTIADSAERPKLDATMTRIDVRPARGSAEAHELGLAESYNKPAYYDDQNRFMLSGLHDEEELEALLAIHDTVIHAAWSGESILDPESHNPANIELAERLLRVAAGLGSVAAPKVVLLSSVNAHVPTDWMERRSAGDFISASEPPTPHAHNRGSKPSGHTRYGYTKIAIEELGAEYAQQHGLDVTVPRLGSLSMADKTSSHYAPHIAIAYSEQGQHFDLLWEEAVRLRHADFVADMQRVVDRDRLTGHFAHYNVVSDTEHRVHHIL